MTNEVEALEPDPLLNRAQLAAIFGVSENTIDKWRKKGMPCETEGGNGVAYEFMYSDCLQWYNDEQERIQRERRVADDFVAQQRMVFLGLNETDPKAQLTPAQKKELAQAELVWMQAARERRSLIDVEEVVSLLDFVFGEFRAGVGGLPDWMEREFSLSGEQVERVVAYTDDILRGVQAAISSATLEEDVSNQVIDPLGTRLL